MRETTVRVRWDTKIKLKKLKREIQEKRDRDLNQDDIIYEALVKLGKNYRKTD